METEARWLGYIAFGSRASTFSMPDLFSTPYQRYKRALSQLLIVVTVAGHWSMTEHISLVEGEKQCLFFFLTSLTTCFAFYQPSSLRKTARKRMDSWRTLWCCVQVGKGSLSLDKLLKRKTSAIHGIHLDLLAVTVNNKTSTKRRSRISYKNNIDP